jgi:hypothetical protein
MAGRGKLRARKGVLRPGSVPGPDLHRDLAPRRAGHGRFRDLRRHCSLAPGPHHHPGAVAR